MDINNKIRKAVEGISQPLGWEESDYKTANWQGELMLVNNGLISSNLLKLFNDSVYPDKWVKDSNINNDYGYNYIQRSNI